MRRRGTIHDAGGLAHRGKWFGGDRAGLARPAKIYHNGGDQAFVSKIHAFNRPTNIRFGPDGCAYVVDYGAVRDLGGGSKMCEGSAICDPKDAPLVQIPGTGVIWKICPK